MRACLTCMLMLVMILPRAAPAPGRRNGETFPKSNPVFRPEDRKAFQTIWPLLSPKDGGIRRTGQAPPGTKPPAIGRWRAVQAEDIRETVLRAAMRRYGAVSRGETLVHFLEVDGKDPSPALLKRFTEEVPAVKPVSRSTSAGTLEYRDRATGQRGKVFWVRNLRWESNSRVRLGGGYRFGGKAAAGDTYILELRGPRWVITGQEGSWRS